MIAQLQQTWRSWFGEKSTLPPPAALPPSTVVVTPTLPPWLTAPRPSLTQLAQLAPAALPLFVRESTTARTYIDLLGPLDWAAFPAHPAGLKRPGPQPAPMAPVVAAWLVKLDKSLKSMGQLRAELVAHPALTWALGFALEPSDTYSWGFDVDRSLPTHRHLNRLLRKLSNAHLQFLLTGTVHLLGQAAPPDVNFGDEICGDTKHIIAWVRENNPKEFIKGGRFHKERQPKGDPDCKVGFKANGNQTSRPAAASGGDAPTSRGPTLTTDNEPTPTTQGRPASSDLPKPKDGEYYWGYASGVVTTTVEGIGDIVLAELTQTFNHADESYFLPLMARTEANLGKKPRFGAWDAAYDTFYVHEYFTLAGGFAAVPWASRDDQKKTFSPDGLPRCAAGLPMPLRNRVFRQSRCLVPHEIGRFACPLLFPEKTGECCPIDHPSWQREGKDQGCLTTLPTSVGARARHELDRASVHFQRLYDQRSAVERINSQAVALGIERPHLRNQGSITNQNTLIYVLINLRALRRTKEKKVTMQRNC